MAMDDDDVIDTLNDLIETCKDGEQGFRECAEDIKRSDLKPFFLAAAERCADSAAELQNEVERLGGTPEKAGTLIGSAHRRWVGIKASIAGQDDKAVLEECERGEDVAKEVYEKALQKDLPPSVRVIVQAQYEGVLQHHDRVRALEKTAQARA